ncbi:hypothetical protein ACHAW5_007796 [Stephanodiscus triporus]|uniref:Endoplasmic reticulum transmembrane protein n=1 Tax=Stephanodiscus triporus TaxID=2934178 RepID=A0ABD3PSX5_9STRA
MSTLRQKRKDHVPTEDVEALIIQDVDDSAAPPSSPMRTSASHLRQNPVVIARMVLRKVGHLLMNDEDAEDITTAGGFIALLKDILIGLIFGMISVSALVFLDFKNVLHMQSAHNYRNMANAMLSDPETRKSVEESSGLHFMTVEDYQRKVNEIKQFPSQLTSIEEKSKKLVPDLEAAKKEYEAIKPDYDKLLADPLLGLDKFCGECSWQGRTSCDGRLSYVIDKYKKSKAESKLSMMESLPQCVKKE